MLHGVRIAGVTNGYVDLEGGAYVRLNSYDECVSVANELQSYPENAGKVFLPVDRGSWVSPRYTVIEFGFQVGDEVSMGFNGDFYPEGKIAKISNDYRIVTLENGKRFFRTGHKLGESWRYDKTWYLVPGIRDERNPSF